MYPTSAAYKTAIRQNVRDVCITGAITLKDTTVINISDEDIVQGSLYFSEQCVSGEDIEIGNVYASEMGLSLSSPPENPYSLDGARVVLNYGIDTGSSYEYVPLGYFYVTEIERKATTVNLKALDGMILFDVDITGVQTSGTPFEIVESCCSKAGITLATSLETFNTFANAGTTFVLPEESNISTCRDLLMWVCQLTGTFARMNRMGHLEIVPVTVRTSVKTISKDERFTSDVSDFFIKVAQVTMKVGETEYSQGTDGMTMALDENPFLIGREDAGINAALGNILNQVTMAEYTPCNVDFAGDPSLQAGDYVKLTDTGTIGGGDVVSMITHHTWRYRGKHNIKAAGKSNLLQGTQSQQSKAVATVVGIARAAQEIAKTANQSTQLINDALGGHVLIRQAPDETNEILIMDTPDPEQATKIWRWNMGGLGYSGNCVGADNPARKYEVAMTMDGAINANFIKTGKIAAQYITVGPESVFADGYDPTAIQIGGRNLIIRYNEVPDTMIGENGVSAPLAGSSMVNEFIPVQPGDTLTFSQAIQGAGDDYFRCAFYTEPVDNATYVVRRISNNSTVFQETAPEGAFWLRVSYATKNKVQLERGNKSTDWAPAPEDIEAYAEHKAAEAQAAAEAVARAEADLAETQAKAYADGAVSAEEQARIDDANAKLTEAKNHAETKASQAQSAAQAYAQQKAAEAQAAAEAVARAEATLAQTNAEAYADSVVTAEEQARIDQAAANLAAAKTHAEEKAAAAEQAAKAYAEPEIYKSPVEPADKTKLWIDTSVIPNVFKRWDATAAAWIKTAPTEASEIGAETPEGAQTKADAAAAEAQAAAEAVAKAEADLAETQAKAYADGIVSDEEQARIQDAQAKLTEAKNHAETKASQAQSAAQAYAQQKAQEAQAAAEAVARAEATLAQTNAEAYADGKVSAEEQARIDQAAANLAAAKTHAETKASEAEVASKAYTDAIEVGGRNLLRNSDAERTGANEYLMYANIAPIFDEHGTGQYTFSFDLKSAVAGSINVYNYDRSADQRKYSFSPTKCFQATTDFQRFSMTVDVSVVTETASHTSLAFYGNYGTGRIPTVRNVKIEKGNKPTDWTPAPEDVDQALADHDANPSPHNLPSYAKMEPTGFKVYDDKGNLRTHNGQYAPGEFGNWVDAGHYLLRDKGMDMSLMQIPNMVLDHSFEMLKEEGTVDVTYYDYAVLNGSGGWGKIGEPRMYSYVSGDGYLSWQSNSFFGVRSVVVNSTNYLQTGFYCKPNTQYFISGFVCLGYRNPTAGTPRIGVEFWDSNEEKWPPEDPIRISTTGQNFTPNTDKKFNWKRVGFAFTTPSNCDQMRIQVKSADANYVCWDAIQVVEANKPVRYDPERTLFWHMDDCSMQVGLGGHIVESGTNSNGHYVKFSDGTQICRFQAILNFTISSPYGSLYLGSVDVWYPKTFVGIPNVCVGSCRHGTGASWGTAYDIGSTHFMMRVIDIVARTNQNLDYGYVAIGRWK